MTRELFIKYLQGGCSEEEFDQLILEIKEGSKSSSGIDIVRKVWEEYEPEAGATNFTKYDQLLDKIHHRINITQNTTRLTIQKSPDRNRILSIITRAAAILLLPVLSLLIYSTLSTKEQFSQNMNDLVVEAPAGSRMAFELGDGTKVWLNHGSKLKYPYRFDGKSRKVFLTGEAYFAVAHNNEVPFIVGTSSLDVKATGTAFNVSAYSDDNFVETTLVEGKVILSERVNNKDIKILSPSECLRFNYIQKDYTLESGNTLKNTSWKEGRLVFRNDSLDVVAKKLARWFNIDIEITNKKVKDFTYTATFTDETLVQILDLMSIPTPVSYKLSGIRKFSDGSFSKQKVLIGLKKNI